MDEKADKRRIIVLVDMDCFYCQVELRDRPDLVGRPMAVCQVVGNENSRSEGFILAVSYEARAYGVKRSMSAQEARRVCPEITLVQAPVMENIHKVDLTRYREASIEVMEALQGLIGMKYAVVEQASIDEAFVDVTELVDVFITKKGPYPTDRIYEEFLQKPEECFSNTFVAGDGSAKGESNISAVKKWLQESGGDVEDLRLAIGVNVAEMLRKLVKKRTGFECSAGIANNIMLAKLVAGLHKPNRQTVLPAKNISKLFETTPISSVRNLGGKFGNRVMKAFDIKTMGELAGIPEWKLRSRFPVQADWLMGIAQGHDDEQVKPRMNPKTITVSKSFPGENSLTLYADVRKWCDGLTKEISKRILDNYEKYNRAATSMAFWFADTDGHHSRTVDLKTIDEDELSECLFDWMLTYRWSTGPPTEWRPAVTHIRMTAQKFVDEAVAIDKPITDWFMSERKQLEEKRAMAVEYQLCDDVEPDEKEEPKPFVYHNRVYPSYEEWVDDMNNRYVLKEGPFDEDSILVENNAEPPVPPHPTFIPNANWRNWLTYLPRDECSIPDYLWEKMPKNIERDIRRYYITQRRGWAIRDKDSQNAAKKGASQTKQTPEGVRKRAALAIEAKKIRKIDEFFPSQSTSQK